MEAAAQGGAQRELPVHTELSTLSRVRMAVPVITPLHFLGSISTLGNKQKHFKMDSSSRISVSSALSKTQALERQILPKYC